MFNVSSSTPVGPVSLPLPTLPPTRLITRPRPDDIMAYKLLFFGIGSWATDGGRRTVSASEEVVEWQQEHRQQRHAPLTEEQRADLAVLYNVTEGAAHPVKEPMVWTWG